MPGESDRDQSIERLLRRASRGAVAQTPTGCPDAETLAAWADRTLSSDETAHVERHLSDCARCQATLAVFARTAPPATTTTNRPHWLRWMIPIAAGSIAAAALIWIAWPEAANSPVSQSARTEPPAVHIASARRGCRAHETGVNTQPVRACRGASIAAAGHTSCLGSD